MRQREPLAKLEPSQQEAGLESSRSAEGRCLDLTLEPDEGLARGGEGDALGFEGEEQAFEARAEPDAGRGAAAEQLDEVVVAATTADGVLVAALSADRNGRRDEAESLYRRALKMDATLALAQNNLAMILVKSGGSLDEFAPSSSELGLGQDRSTRSSPRRPWPGR